MSKLFPEFKTIPVLVFLAFASLGGLAVYDKEFRDDFALLCSGLAGGYLAQMNPLKSGIKANESVTIERHDIDN